MLHVGVVWDSCECGMVRDVDCGCVMRNTLCFEMWWCEMVVGSRLRCNAMSPTSDSESDVEYGGPSETYCDIKCLRDATWKMWYVVILCGTCNGGMMWPEWCDAKGGVM